MQLEHGCQMFVILKIFAERDSLSLVAAWALLCLQLERFPICNLNLRCKLSSSLLVYPAAEEKSSFSVRGNQTHVERFGRSQHWEQRDVKFSTNVQKKSI